MATKTKKPAAKKAAAKKPAVAKKPAKKAVVAKKKPVAKPAAKKAPAKKPIKKPAVKVKAVAPKKKAAAPKAVAPKKPVKKEVAKKAVVVPPKKKGPQPPSRPVLLAPRNGTTKQYTQNELMQCLQGSCGFTTKAEAREFYANFCALLYAALKSGYKLALPGLGKMLVVKTKARNGRNPATGEAILIKAKKKVRFSASKALKDAVL